MRERVWVCCCFHLYLFSSLFRAYSTNTLDLFNISRFRLVFHFNYTALSWCPNEFILNYSLLWWCVIVSVCFNHDLALSIHQRLHSSIPKWHCALFVFVDLISNRDLLARDPAISIESSDATNNFKCLQTRWMANCNSKKSWKWKYAS